MYTLFLLAAAAVDQDPDHLIRQLGHPRFAVRHQAHCKLLQINDTRSYFQLKSFTTSDPEIINRKALILQSVQVNLHTKLRPKFSVNLMGYPKYPWILEAVPAEYQWRNLQRHQIYSKYMHDARQKNYLPLAPDFPGNRKATELWLADRIDLDLQDALRQANSEHEIYQHMAKCMKEIQDDVSTMIDGENRWWGDRKNPLLFGK